MMERIIDSSLLPREVVFRGCRLKVRKRVRRFAVWLKQTSASQSSFLHDEMMLRIFKRTSNPVFRSHVLRTTCHSPPVSYLVAMANERAKQISAHLNYPKGMLVGQTAIITGSGQGIGAEAARLFANEGAKVVISDIDKGTASKRSSAGCH